MTEAVIIQAWPGFYMITASVMKKLIRGKSVLHLLLQHILFTLRLSSQGNLLICNTFQAMEEDKFMLSLRETVPTEENRSYKNYCQVFLVLISCILMKFFWKTNRLRFSPQHIQKWSSVEVLSKSIFEKFCKMHSKNPVPKSLL